MKIKEAFDINQGHQITDEEIYNDIINNGKIPILTANNEIKGFWRKSIIKKSDLPCITYPTKANSGTCFVQNNIFDANNTAILIPKSKWRNRIFLEWFAYKLSNIFLKVATSKEGVNYLNKEIVEELEFELPDKKIQKMEFISLSKIISLKKKIDEILSKIRKIKSSLLSIDYKKFQARDVPINEILKSISGNSGLTEEYLYQNTLLEKDKNYKVLTGSINVRDTEMTNLCQKPKDKNNKIDVFYGKGIHVVRKGKAGIINYLKKDYYTLNDDAYILTIKDNVKYKISLK